MGIFIALHNTFDLWLLKFYSKCSKVLLKMLVTPKNKQCSMKFVCSFVALIHLFVCQHSSNAHHLILKSYVLLSMLYLYHVSLRNPQKFPKTPQDQVLNLSVWNHPLSLRFCLCVPEDLLPLSCWRDKSWQIWKSFDNYSS